MADANQDLCRDLVEFRKAWIADINVKSDQSEVSIIGKHRKKPGRAVKSRRHDKKILKNENTNSKDSKLPQPIKDGCKLNLKRCSTDICNENKKFLNMAANSRYKKNTQNLLNLQEKSPSQSRSLQISERENLLEILISDIDETVSLPFFDLELPRETALNIFKFLSMKDLMNCCLVNKQWQYLAEDDLLWYNISLQFDLETDSSCASDREGWKNIVKNLLLKERKLKKNWKERICQISELEYVKGGILYAAFAFKDKVITGYANGVIKVWDIHAENPSASFGNLQPESEFSHERSITCVCINADLCAAGYSNGDVVLWQNGLDFPLVNRYSKEATIDCLDLGRNSCSVISSNGCKVRVDAADENGLWSSLYNGNCDKYITSVRLYDSSSYQAVLSTNDSVEIHDMHGNIEVLEKVLAAKVSCIWHAERRVCIGITPLQYSILDGYRIKEYCLETRGLRHLMKGPQSKLTCVHGNEYLQNLMAAGCSDKIVRIHDNRSENVAMHFSGIPAVPSALQINDWKVIAGDLNGFISVWDQRSQALLWQTRTRHPVRICHIAGPCLVTASLPLNKNPKETFWYADDLIQHRRYRGSIRILNFDADNFVSDVPEICQSEYVPLIGYNYNINLSTPYDFI